MRFYWCGSAEEESGNRWSDARQSSRPGRASLCVEATERAAKSSQQNMETHEEGRRKKNTNKGNNRKIHLISFKISGEGSCLHSATVRFKMRKEFTVKHQWDMKLTKGQTRRIQSQTQCYYLSSIINKQLSNCLQLDELSYRLQLRYRPPKEKNQNKKKKTQNGLSFYWRIQGFCT